MLATGQNAHGNAIVVEGRGSDSSTVSRRVGPHTEDVPPFRFVHDGGIDGWVVGAGDRVPGSVQVTVLIGPQLEIDRGHAFDGRGRVRRDHVDIGSAGDQQAETRCATDPAPTTTTLRPARRRPTR